MFIYFCFRILISLIYGKNTWETEFMLRNCNVQPTNEFTLVALYFIRTEWIKEPLISVELQSK